MGTSGKKLLLKSAQSPGDILMLTAAVRDLHRAHPGRFMTGVQTTAREIWENNPYVSDIDPDDPQVLHVDMHYPLIHESNQRPYHFIHGYAQFLGQLLASPIPLTEFRGDIHLSEEEQATRPSLDVDFPDDFWIIVAGGKYDFTAKWWNPAFYQAVVDHFAGKISFVQCGAGEHWHPRLNNVVDLVGKTTLRQFVHLMHHAVGVVCPVTFAMHAAAAVVTKPGRPSFRPCVVIAGAREPAHWEAYPNHQFISTCGALPCCEQGGCWKSRCQLVGDGDPKDVQNVCENPVQLTASLRIPRCMDMITPEDVIRRIEWYYHGGLPCARANPPRRFIASEDDYHRASKRISVSFYHGLGDSVYFAHLIPLYRNRGYEVEVECTPDKHILFEAGGATTVAKARSTHPWGYPPGMTYPGQGRFWQGSKLAHNISEPPLPNIGERSDLWQEYCETRIDIEPLLPDEAKRTADDWVTKLPPPIVLFHSKGNTAQDRKSLPDAITAQFYKQFIDQCDGTLVLLDWDARAPRLASHRVRHLDEFGSCSLDVLLALIARSDLMVGVDSGPLHVSRFTKTRAIGIWMPGHYPTTYALPRREQLNVVLQEHTQQWNRFKRIPWNIVEHPGSTFDAKQLAGFCRQMLSAPRYHGEQEMAADVQLQQLIRELCRGEAGNALSSYSDRNRSFDILFREMSRRFTTPTVVETGVIRAEEDWSGAGFFTYLAGAYLYRSGGRLHAVDIAPQNCEFARVWTEVFGPTVEVHQQDSVEFLRQFAGPIDVLYLDSLDTTEPNHAQHAFQETEAALPKLHDQSLIVFDDTPWQAGAWVGKGETAVPFLLQSGWKILYAGYQVLLARE